MTCKRSKQCDNAYICQLAQSTEYNLLGGSCFTPKDPQTNEEWMKVVSVSEAIGYFCYKALGSDGCNACRLNTKEKCRLNEWLKEKHE